MSATAKDVSVKLTHLDKKVCILVANERASESKDVDDPLADAHGLQATKEEGWAIDFQGAKGECGLAKYLNVYWVGSVNTFKHERDVGGVFDVRSVDTWNKRLIVRADDPDDAYFVLVLVEGDACYIRGYILGKDAKKGKWLRDYGDRESAFFVPVDALKDPRELKDLYIQLKKGE